MSYNMQGGASPAGYDAYLGEDTQERTEHELLLDALDTQEQAAQPIDWHEDNLSIDAAIADRLYAGKVYGRRYASIGNGLYVRTGRAA